MTSYSSWMLASLIKVITPSATRQCARALLLSMTFWKLPATSAQDSSLSMISSSVSLGWNKKLNMPVKCSKLRILVWFS